MKDRTISIVSGIVAGIVSVGLVGGFIYWAVVVDPSRDEAPDEGEVEALGEFVGSASPLVVDQWGGKIVSTFCIGGEEDYGSGPNASAPVQEGIAWFFDGMVVDDGCDATITVSIVGEARSATYDHPDPLGVGDRIELYLGAQVEGTMSLTADGESPLTAPIGGIKSPPGSITVREGTGIHSYPRSPLGAPFWEAISDSVCRVMQGWFGADDPHLSPCRS